MTRKELKTTGLLAGIYMTRMLGLFLIFPTFSALAQGLAQVTPTKIGLALGIYSLAQALLQIPIGWLSDIIGRKKVLYFGLTLFFLGSLLASATPNINVMIAARLLQGMGAVSAVCLAYVGDSIRPSEQGKAMMIVGMAIGAAFMLAFVLGTAISQHWGLSGIFRATALLALLALFFAYLLPQAEQTKSLFSPKQLVGIIANKRLFIVNLQVLVLHMTLSASFFLLPLLIGEISSFFGGQLYTLPLIITAVVVAPLVRNRDKGVARLPYFWSIFALALLLLAILPVYQQASAFMAVVSVFFVGFTLVETLLPAQLFQFVKAENRGASSGTFSLFQFSGSFLGGLLGAKYYAILSVNGTIQSGFYLLAIPVVAMAVVGLFTHKQQR